MVCLPPGRSVLSIPPINCLRAVVSTPWDERGECKNHDAVNEHYQKRGVKRPINQDQSQFISGGEISMFGVSKARICLAVAALALAIITGSLSAHAQDISQDSIKILQAQIDALQKQLEEVKAAQAAAAAKAAAAEPAKPSQHAAAAPGERGTFEVGHTKVTVGGFVEAAGIY